VKILVTGAAGFIGSHLAERLLGDDHEVIGYDSFSSFLYDAATKERNVAPLAGRKGWRLERADLLDPKRLVELTKGCDLVVHLAALAGVRPSIAEPALYARTNVEGTVNVLEACRANGIQRLVFASSSSVYGARPGAVAGFREDDPCLESASPYAATKRAGELIVHTYRDLFGLGSASLRFFTVYGPRQRPDFRGGKLPPEVELRGKRREGPEKRRVERDVGHEVQADVKEGEQSHHSAKLY